MRPEHFKGATPRRMHVLFVICVLLGMGAFIHLVGTAFFARSTTEVTGQLWITCAVSFVAGLVCAVFEPKQRLIWCLGFALPLLGWGGICALAAVTDGIKMLVWLAIGLGMTLGGLLGALLGRWIKRE